MTVMKYNGVHADALRKAHAAKAEQGVVTRDRIVEILEKATQPLVATEVRALHAKRNGRLLDISYITNVLRGLAADGRISSREETPIEREIRRNGDGRGSHIPATYYAPVGVVPARTLSTEQTVAIAMPATRQPKRSGKARPKTTSRRRPVAASPVQTGSSSDVETIKTLVLRIAQLEQQLAEIRKLAN